MVAVFLVGWWVCPEGAKKMDKPLKKRRGGGGQAPAPPKALVFRIFYDLDFDKNEVVFFVQV
ncbi:MAG: hypothetical protein DRP50_05535 [Thermotoga sp.]|nr:MAG: hypothetical protein DRP50_05535 [Thermotoga sp.]